MLGSVTAGVALWLHGPGEVAHGRRAVVDRQIRAVLTTPGVMPAREREALFRGDGSPGRSGAMPYCACDEDRCRFLNVRRRPKPVPGCSWPRPRIWEPA
jgi:hypothetical protein